MAAQGGRLCFGTARGCVSLGFTPAAHADLLIATILSVVGFRDRDDPNGSKAYVASKGSQAETPERSL